MNEAKKYNEKRAGELIRKIESYETAIKSLRESAKVLQHELETQMDAYWAEHMLPLLNKAGAEMTEEERSQAVADFADMTAFRDGALSLSVRPL